jgi:hypothetical protein
MKRLISILAIAMVFILVSGVVAAPKTLNELENSDKDVFEKYVEDIAVEKKINIDNETKIEKVDFEKLPENLNLQNIDDTNLAVYEVDSGDGKPVYILTLSKEAFEKTQEAEDYKRMLLNFGLNREVSASGFLETATGVEGSVEKGYVMVRDGSITAISTNLEILKSMNSEQYERAELIIYKNGKPIGFGNNLDIFTEGVQNDYDVQSEGTVEFQAGDVISVYLEFPNGVEIGDVTTLLEITTLD